MPINFLKLCKNSSLKGILFSFQVSKHCTCSFSVNQPPCQVSYSSCFSTRMRNCFARYGTDPLRKVTGRISLLLPHPGALLLHINPSPLLYTVLLQSCTSCTVTYRTLLHQCSDPAAQNKLWSQTRTTMFTKTGNQEFGCLTLLENKSSYSIFKKLFLTETLDTVQRRCLIT